MEKWKNEQGKLNECRHGYLFSLVWSPSYSIYKLQTTGKRWIFSTIRISFSFPASPHQRGRRQVRDHAWRAQLQAGRDQGEKEDPVIVKRQRERKNRSINRRTNACGSVWGSIRRRRGIREGCGSSPKKLFKEDLCNVQIKQPISSQNWVYLKVSLARKW